MDGCNDQEEKNKVGSGHKEYTEPTYEILIEQGGSPNAAGAAAPVTSTLGGATDTRLPALAN
jgi:hypothetical protein